MSGKFDPTKCRAKLKGTVFISDPLSGCFHSAKFNIYGIYLCGKHIKIAERWDKEGRLKTMLKMHWGVDIL